MNMFINMIAADIKLKKKFCLAKSLCIPSTARGSEI